LEGNPVCKKSCLLTTYWVRVRKVVKLRDFTASKMLILGKPEDTVAEKCDTVRQCHVIWFCACTNLPLLKQNNPENGGNTIL
jgi:hypothetical protein